MQDEEDDFRIKLDRIKTGWRPQLQRTYLQIMPIAIVQEFPKLVC